jgi:TonB-linked SusC/RagA family outer membrane protein
LSFACIAALIAVICRKSRILIHFFPYLHFYKLLLMLIIKRLLWIVPLFILSASSLAQEKTVSGTVLSAKDDEPVANATVTNRNTKKNTTTTSTGRFTIKASRGDVLEITSVGHLKITVTVGDAAEIPVKMQVNEKQLSEVVVTSLGIKKEKRGLGFSSQELKGDDVAQTQRENFFNAIQGRVAGATLVQTSGAPGASSNIVLRGFNSLSGSNSPLIVVDGLPISNNTLDQHQLASNGDNRYNDYTNRAADINPDDIESINILKGPEATALYGIEAGSGAIIITTKKAKKGKLKVTYDNNFRVTHVYRFPHIQKVYSNGSNGVESNTRQLFGPRFPIGTKFYNNIEKFFEDGFQQKQNITLEGGKYNTAFRFNVTWRDEKGTIPNTGLEQLQTRITLNQKLLKNLEVNFTGAYSNTRNDKALRGTGGFLHNLMLWPITDDASIYLLPNGTRKFFLDPDASGNQPNEADNPFFEVNKNVTYDKTDRGIFNLTIDYDPFDWWNITVRGGADIYEQFGLTYLHPESNQARTIRGQVEDYTQKFNSYNGVLINTFKKNFGKLKTTLRAGVANDDWVRKTFAHLGRTLKDSVTKNVSVATTLVTSREVGADTLTKKRLQGVFGEIGLNYDDIIYLTATGRNDWTSTLPVQARSFFYPSYSLAFIISELIAPESKWMNFWKLRASRAETAKDISPYGSQSWYTNAPGATNAYGWSYDFYNQNPKIVPERQETYEVGTEMRLFNNRLSLEYTYYHTKNLDQIVRLVRLSYGTGFILNTSNISDTENKGHEVTLGITAIKKKNFTWRMNYNFNRMTNRITRIPNNIPEFYNSDTWLGNFRAGLTRNGTITQLTGQNYLRNNTGQILIDPTTGYPIPDPNYTKIADRNPDFQLGISNTFTYKNITFSCLLDIKAGGDILNANEIWMTQNGVSLRTLDREVPRIYPGVLRDGLENTSNPTPNTISVLPHFQSSIYTDRSMAVDYVEKDVNWLRVRDVTIRFNAGKRLLDKLKYFSSAAAFITGTDLFLITNYTGVDPTAAGNSAATLGNGSFGVDFGSLSIPRGLNFGLSLQFAKK